MSLSKLGTFIYESGRIEIEKALLDLTSGIYPKWLDYLCGKSPLLGRDELDFITEVQKQILLEARSRPTFSCDVQLGNKLSVMKNNFSYVIQYLKGNSRSSEYFVANYPQWRGFRDRTISQLKNIARSVDNKRRENAETRQAGSSMSLIGGLLCLATGGAIGLVGKVLIGFGTLSSIAVSVTEINELREMIKEAEKIIRVDKEYSERLWNWISDLSHVQDALNTIQNINIDKDLKKSAEAIHACFTNKSTPEKLKAIIGNALKSMKFSDKTITEISDVIGILIAKAMLVQRYRLLFNQVLEAHKCYRTLSIACSLVASTLKITSGGSLSLSHFQKSRIFTGIALDALNIILASKDLESTSKEAEEIVKAAEKLNEEAKIFQNLYDVVISL